MEDFRPLFDENSDHPYVLDQLKQISFYTDCLGKAHWSIPEEVVDKSLAQLLVQTAKIFSEHKKNVTTLEIELWIKHLSPVWKTSMTAMKMALVTWNKEMIKNGLSAECNGMEKFLNIKIR